MSREARAFLRVRVVARASRTQVSRDASGVVRIHLTAAPVDGAANRALIALLAERLGLPRRAFELTRGERSRDKLVCVHDTSPAELERLLARGLLSSVDKSPGRG